MSTDKLFIPSRIKVGFQKREGTYTGKLAYIVYFDQKNVLRKERSWNAWRDHKIEPLEYDNEPTEGFVLNKGVGGNRSHYNHRNEYIRVYDPRDFEFEISVANLLFILREGDCSRGKGLEGKFVYAWSGTELVLLPVASADYQQSSQYTILQAQSVKSKELIPGANYLTRKQETLIYLGRFDYHYLSERRGQPGTATVVKRYVFYNEKVCQYSKKPVGFVCLDSIKGIAQLNSDVISSNYARLVSKYHKGEHGSAVKELLLREVKRKPRSSGDRYHEWAFQDGGGFVTATACYDYSDPAKLLNVHTRNRYHLTDGVLHRDYHAREFYNRSATAWNHFSSCIPADMQPTNNRLFARLESGAVIPVHYNTFSKGN